jgi:site-specific DNA-methyltransferase (adenine-specific)
MNRNTELNDNHCTATDAKLLLPAGADFGNGIFLYNEDCLQALRKLNDKQFNLAITDPPYNVGRLYNEHDDEMPLWKYEMWCREWFDELLRVSETVVMTVGYKNLKFWMNLDPKHMIIWHKPNQNSPSPLGGFNAYEPVLFWGKTQKRIGHDIFKTNIAMQEEAAWHNCPKHLPSWIKLIDMIVNKPAKVIDPFSGSGTTAIACHKLKLEFVGYELDSMYYDKACKRIQGYVNQLELW